MKFSVIIPARDEEKNIGACLDSLKAASRFFPGDVEAIVVLNRCTDATESIARAAGARIVREDAKNLSRIRNAGAAVATGGIIATIDADSTMSENVLLEIDRKLSSGQFVGGGVKIVPERWSVGIFVSVILLFALLPKGISAGMFWCYRKDFEALGGFDEKFITAEDIDFAVRLKALGKTRGQRFGTIMNGQIRTSCRKFDYFGDWFILRKIRISRDIIRGHRQDIGDMLFYDFKR